MTRCMNVSLEFGQKKIKRKVRNKIERNSQGKPVFFDYFLQLFAISLFRLSIVNRF